MSHFPIKPAVGDRLLMVTETERHRVPKAEPVLVPVTVTKVGRVYGEAQRDDTASTWGAVRFKLENGNTGEAYRSTVSRVWRSEEAWREAHEAKELWLPFRRCADRCTPPPGVTAADIREAAKLLKLDLPK